MALFVVSGSIKLFSIDCVTFYLIVFANIYLFLVSFSIAFARWKTVQLPQITYIMKQV